VFVQYLTGPCNCLTTSIDCWQAYLELTSINHLNGSEEGKYVTETCIFFGFGFRYWILKSPGRLPPLWDRSLPLNTGIQSSFVDRIPGRADSEVFCPFFLNRSITL